MGRNKNKYSKNIVFIVQGEGRGHMTQAISAFQILEEAGYKIVCTTIGTNKNRFIPPFFYEQIGDSSSQSKTHSK